MKIIVVAAVAFLGGLLFGWICCEVLSANITGDCFYDKEDFAKYIEFIEQLPPIQPKLLQPWEVLVAQAVLPQPEIVRCKDCQHYKYGICKKAGLCVNKSQNGFCDWGERKQHEH